MDNLYIFGCSFSYGQGLEDRHNESYGSIISKELGLEPINLSVKGTSNSWIMNRIITSNVRNCKILVGWTALARYGTVFSNQLRTIMPRDVNSTESYIKDLSTNYFKTHNDETDYIKFFTELVMLQGYLRSKNVDWYFVPSFDTMRTPNESKMAPEYFDTERHIDWTRFFTDTSFITLINHNNHKKHCVNPKCLHPTKLGHTLWAERLMHNLPDGWAN